MTFCAIINCSNATNKVRVTGNRFISFHRFPRDPDIKKKWIEATGRKNWFPTKNSRICSVHFREDTFTGAAKFRRVIRTACPTIDVVIMSGDGKLSAEAPPRALPRRGGDVSDGSVSPITDPEDEADTETQGEGEVRMEDEPETEVKIEVEVGEEEMYKVNILDPLSQSSLQGSFKELHSHQPGAGHAQPSTSSAATAAIKIEAEDEDYKAMYFRLQEEVEALRTENHNLVAENQSLSETNKVLGQEIEHLLEQNNRNDVQNLKNENVKLTDTIQELTEKNKTLNENITYLTEKIEELTEKTQEFSEEKQTREKVQIFSDYIQKIQNLNDKIRDLTKENTSLSEERHNLDGDNRHLTEIIEELSKENRSLRLRSQSQKKFMRRLQSCCTAKLERRCKEARELRRYIARLKVVNARLRGSQK